MQNLVAKILSFITTANCFTIKLFIFAPKYPINVRLAMTYEYQLRVLPQQGYNEEAIKQYLSREKGLDIRTINVVRVLKKSIDARQRTIYVNLKVRAYVNEYPDDEAYQPTEYPNVEGRPQVVVVGEDPAVSSQPLGS